MKNNFMGKLKGNKNLLKLSITGLVSALSLYAGATFNVKATASPKPTATQTSESSEKDKDAKDASAAEILEEKNQTVVDVPHFVPTSADVLKPGEERKNILIVGAHPDEDRWKEWWKPLSEKYNLTFLQHDLPARFGSSEDEIIIGLEDFADTPDKRFKVWNLDSDDVAYTPDKHVEVWKLDFNAPYFGKAMMQFVKKGKTFDLVINDYSVYKFFTGKFPYEVATALVSLLKPTGHCVLGPLGSEGGASPLFRYPRETQCVQVSSFDIQDFSLWIWEQQKCIDVSWNIGSTEADKQKILEQLNAIKNPDLAEACRNLIEKKSKEITVETATTSVNTQLQKGPLVRATFERKWKEINPIQPVLVKNIQSQLDEILPSVVYASWNSPTSMWMIVSPKQD